MSPFGRSRKITAATLIALSSTRKCGGTLADGSEKCQMIFDLFDECMSQRSHFGANSCHHMDELMASCQEHKRVPGRRSIADKHKELVESFQREATAAGFADIDEYLNHRLTTNFRLCSMAYDLYNKCLSEDGANKSACEWYRNDCPQFK